MAIVNERLSLDTAQAEKLQGIRHGLGVTVTGMAESLGVSVGTLRKWLTGERKMSAIAWSAIMMMMEIQRLERKIKDMSK